MARSLPLLWAIVLLVAAGCAPRPPAALAGLRGMASLGPPPTYRPDGRFGRVRLFRSLVRTVRRQHVDTPRIWQNLGFRWDSQLPDLEKEFAQAAGPRELKLALWHFGNSLHNPHCFFRSRRLPRRFHAGFDLEVEWLKGKPRFYVAKIQAAPLRKRLRIGDQLLALDGTPAAHLLHVYRHKSNANNRRRLARDLAFYLTHPLQWERERKARPSSWRFRRRSSGQEVTLSQRWRPWTRTRYEWVERRFDYRRPYCERYRKKTYGAYRLAASGINFCLYTSDKPRYRPYPIVRQYSFKYSLGNRGAGPIRNTTQFVMADYHNLRGHLRRLRGVKGVILDLRDNLGGNNWNWFLEWWAPAPWKGMTVEVRLNKRLGRVWGRGLKRYTNLSWSQRIRWYLESLRLARPGQKYGRRRPLFCGAKTCLGPNRYTPRKRILPVPVALLTGPVCSSSCDNFARVFDENDFGPLIGEPTDTGATIQRFRHHVRLARRGSLGYLRLALSREFSGRTGQRNEGSALRIDYPHDRTFANRKRYDRELVDLALKAFREFRYPTPEGGGSARGE